jgi:hypothetical protein
VNWRCLLREGCLAAAIAVACLAARASASSDATSAPVEHRRTPDQTFLTFPEWYLVHSPAEYAAYLGRGGAPSAFPLFAHIGQFWQSYRVIGRELAPYPFNSGYHLMVMVIGTSTTLEYGLKGLYENTAGRLAEATKTGDAPVPEEGFAAAYAQAYVDFIRIDPWYLFDFGARLKALWADVPSSGPNLLRRWERRFALTSELLAKEGYARLIKLGTQGIYDAPKPVTAVVLSAAPANSSAACSGAPPAPVAAGVLTTLPRYEAFTTCSRSVAAQGITFSEIAGNRGGIVVSLLLPDERAQGRSDDWAGSGLRTRTLFTQPILTRPGAQRVVLVAPVDQLSALLRWVEARHGAAAIEHVYDY